MGEPLLTTRQVAERLEVTAGTVQKWQRDGKLPSLRTPGGALRFRWSDIEAVISAPRVGSAA